MVALLLPDWRSPKVNDTSAARSAGLRTRISSRILNPRGRSLSSSTASRRTRKKPLIGSVTSWSRRGKSSRAAVVVARDAMARPHPSPRASPPSQ